jgi:hypothetical protein
MLLCEVSIAPAIADEAKAPKQAGDAWPVSLSVGVLHGFTG